MCLLTFIPKGVTPDRERFERAAKSNPDGFGFAIHAGDHIVTDKDMNFDLLWSRWQEARKTETGPALFHFRITTHGVTDLTNCHPFTVGGDPLSVLAHNGMLDIEVPKGDLRSDTHLFAQHVLPEFGGVAALDDETNMTAIETWARGSKMVILSASPLARYDWYIINEKDGHWAHDMWWSNHSYIYRAPALTSYGSYGGWGGHYGGSDWYKDYKYKQDSLDFTTTTTTTTKSSGTTTVYGDEVDEVLDCWANEMYDDATALRLLDFTDVVSSTDAYITCPCCLTVFEVDPYNPSATHCGECGSCFHCGDDRGDCSCWDNYPYDKSFVVLQENGAGENVVFDVERDLVPVMGDNYDW